MPKNRQRVTLSRGLQGCSTDSIFLEFLVYIFSAPTFLVLVGGLQKVKHAWLHAQFCDKCESKACELNIQNSWLLLKLSGLFNSHELSSMLETKPVEIQCLLKPEKFSQAFAEGLLHLQIVYLTWFMVYFWFALGSECGTQQAKKIIF